MLYIPHTVVTILLEYACWMRNSRVMRPHHCSCDRAAVYHSLGEDSLQFNNVMSTRWLQRTRSEDVTNVACSKMKSMHAVHQNKVTMRKHQHVANPG